MNVLVIFQSIPDYTKVYVLSDLSKETFERICSCNDRYVNIDGDDDEDGSLEWLSELLDGKVPIYSDNDIGRNTDLVKRPGDSYDAIVVTGFIM